MKRIKFSLYQYMNKYKGYTHRSEYNHISDILYEYSYVGIIYYDVIIVPKFRKI